MDEDTVIQVQNVTISTHDELMSELWFAGNRQIFFLPVGVAEIFPNLLVFFADDCEIKGISKENFQKILSEKFKDLNDLIELDFGEKFCFV